MRVLSFIHRCAQPLNGKTWLRLFSFLAVFCAGTTPAHATRVEELCDIRGIRTNQLIGYGLVVGLAGTGDTGQAKFTIQSVAAMLRRLGAFVDQATIQTKNAAAVVVTATLPAFSNPGARIDVNVSSLGNARSLLGGTLLQTPLYGGDRHVYAVAQGPVVIGGFSAGGSSGTSVSLNHVTAGRVPGGAIVERPVPTTALQNNAIFLALRNPNFVTAQRIADSINQNIAQGIAAAVDSGTVRVSVPQQFRRNPVGLVASLHALDVDPNNTVRVVIDERTGTVVLGGGLRISEVAVAQGGLTVEITETPAVSQPNPLGNGETVVVPQTEVRAQSRPGSLHHLTGSASLADVVTALNSIGANPRDLIAIFQALRTAGALQAELELQ